MGTWVFRLRLWVSNYALTFLCWRWLSCCLSGSTRLARPLEMWFCLSWKEGCPKPEIMQKGIVYRIDLAAVQLKCLVLLVVNSWCQHNAGLNSCMWLLWCQDQRQIRMWTSLQSSWRATTSNRVLPRVIPCNDCTAISPVSPGMQIYKVRHLSNSQSNSQHRETEVQLPEQMEQRPIFHKVHGINGIFITLEIHMFVPGPACIL